MLNPVLESLKPVLENPKYVSIDYEKLEALAEALGNSGNLEDFQLPTWRSPAIIEEDSERTIEYFLVANTLNFKFWYDDTFERFKLDHKGTWVGAFGMLMCLTRALEWGIPITEPTYLKNLSLEECKQIFSGDRVMTMIEERTEILNEAGRVLAEKYGSFKALADEAKGYCFGDAIGGRGKGTGIVERLVNDFPSFNDVAIYEPTGDLIKFYKRAQLVVAMLYARLKGTDLFPIHDIDSLTIFADYQVPKGLWVMGVLEYAQPLLEKIRNRQLLGAGGIEEIEIRAHAIRAADVLIQKINKIRSKDEQINAVHIDYYIW